MTQYNTLNVKLFNSNTLKNGAEIAEKLSSNVMVLIMMNLFPCNLLLTNT